MPTIRRIVIRPGHEKPMTLRGVVRRDHPAPTPVPPKKPAKPKED